MKKIELLAPAGSFEKAKIAFLYGADAVYCGTSSLSLRTRADMKDDDLVNTIKYAHKIGKKVYVTLNIFGKNIRRAKTRWCNNSRWRDNGGI